MCLFSSHVNKFVNGILKINSARRINGGGLASHCLLGNFLSTPQCSDKGIDMVRFARKDRSTASDTACSNSSRESESVGEKVFTDRSRREGLWSDYFFPSYNL